MSRLKQLKELKNSTIDELVAIHEKAQKRSFTSKEHQEMALLQARVEELDKEIKAEQETIRRSCVQTNSKEVRKECEEMKNFENFLQDETRKQYVENKLETREIGVSLKSENTAVVPQFVADQVVKHLVEFAPLFGMARAYNVNVGELAVPIETDANLFECGFVGENQAVAINKVTLETKKLISRRCGASVQLTEQLVQDAGAANTANYVVELLARRMAVAINKACLIGNRDDGEFEGILNNEDVQKVQVAELSAEALIDLTRSLSPQYLAGAVMVMNRDVFKAVSKIVDGAGHFIMIHDFSGEAPVYRVQGVQVFVDVHMPANQILLANPHEACATLIRNNFRLRRIDNDTENALKGLQLLVADMYADFIVVNTEAAAILEVSAE